MNLLQKLFFGAYLIVGIFNVIGEQLDQQLLVNVSKPLLMPLLALGIIFSQNFTGIKGKYLIILALLMAWIGDIVLLLDNLDKGDYFLLGLASFAITQGLYILIMRGYRTGVFKQKYIALLVLAMIYLVFLWFMYPLIELSLFIAICIYGLLISVMVWNAWALHDRPPSGMLILMGAALFFISDLTIALTRFTNLHFGPIASGVIIMLTYIFAQFYIIFGLSKIETKAG